MPDPLVSAETMNSTEPEPVREQALRFAHDDLQFVYKKYQTSRSNGTLVILHGFAQDLETWNPIARQLATHFTVLVLRQRGYGKRCSPSSTSSYSLAHIRSDVIALMAAEATQSAHIVGHDLGGLVAWSLARESPDAVRSLIAISMPDARASARAMIGRQVFKSWYIGALQVPLVGSFVTGAFDGRLAIAWLTTTGLPREHAARYVRRARRISKWRPSIFKWYRAFRFDVNELTTRNLVKVPTLMIWGQGDKVVLRSTMERSKRWATPVAKLWELDNGGHWLPENNPIAVCAIIVDQLRAVDSMNEGN